MPTTTVEKRRARKVSEKKKKPLRLIIQEELFRRNLTYKWLREKSDVSEATLQRFLGGTGGNIRHEQIDEILSALDLVTVPTAKAANRPTLYFEISGDEFPELESTDLDRINITRAMLRDGKTVAKIAKQLNLSRQAYYKWLKTIGGTIKDHTVV